MKQNNNIKFVPDLSIQILIYTKNNDL